MKRLQHCEEGATGISKLGVICACVFLLPLLISSLPKKLVASPIAKTPVSNPAPIRTPKKVKVNRTLPKMENTPNPLEQNDFDLTDEEIFRLHVFEEPLVPIRGETTSEENEALARALKAYQARSDDGRVEPILQFLREYPASPWRAPLLTNLGIVYRRSGYFTKAMIAWEQAWDLSKNETNPRAVNIADRAIAEVAELNSRVGRFDKLEQIFAEIKTRELHGSATEKIAGAKIGLWNMKNHPDTSFRCGPMALGMIRRAQGLPPLSGKIAACKSTSKGTSLAQVSGWAHDLGMDFQMAKRNPGGPVIVPSVINWKLGHFAAITKEENGKYLVQDPTFSSDIWVTRKVIDEEASGYFLIPSGPLPSKWQVVKADEGATVWGKGTVTGQKQTGSDTQAQCQCPPCNGMARYWFGALRISLHLEDIPVGYAPPVGPAVQFHVSYDQRDPFQPSNFSYSNLGAKWTFNWLSYVTDDPGNASADVSVYGGANISETYTGYNSSNHLYATQFDSRAILERKTSSSYERCLPDGSKEVFDKSDGSTSYPRKLFLTQVIDPAGNALTYTYDTSLRLTAVTDAIGQVTTLTYGLGGDNLKITRVTDPFGRHADFDYNGSGRLIRITDTIGVTSEFAYSSDFINALTTPYGTTSFSYSENGIYRSLEVLNAAGERERVEFTDSPPNVVSAEVIGAPTISGARLAWSNNNLQHRTSYYWDKRAMLEYTGDTNSLNYTHAVQYHWIHDYPDDNTASNILESRKAPLESRVWYQYPGQDTNSTSLFLTTATLGSPSEIGRLLDDGSTQAYRYEYNDLGKITKITDPLARQTTYVYSTNLVDLLEVRQTSGTNNQLLASFTYNSQHRPLTAVNASGQTNSMTYNSHGQLLSLTNSLGEATSLGYSTNGYLTNITHAVAGSTTSLSYDGYGRVQTITDSEGYAVSTDYDDADRITLVTFPDSTTRQYVYSRLDLTEEKDRLGRWTRTYYDSQRRVTAVRDPLGRLTQYTWCRCGALDSIVDPSGHKTGWDRDVQGRVTAKRYADGTSYSYAYENNISRLKSVTDPLGQVKNYEYFSDNNLKEVSYDNAVHSTPAVSFAYDTNFDRLVTMIDGVGTNTYSYNAITGAATAGANRLHSVDGPLGSDTITFTYDAVGRSLSRAINGSTNAVTYDALSRVTTASNALGTTTYTYTNATARLASILLPNSQKIVFDYYNNAGDQRLKTIWNQTSGGATISKFGYEYNAEGQITGWTQQTDSNTPRKYFLSYNSVDQLASAVLHETASNSVLKTYVYSYDPPGNRTSEQIDNGVTGATYNNLNQITVQQPGVGPVRFVGSVSEPSTVTVAGASASVGTNNFFLGAAQMSVGTNQVSVIAQDYSGNSRTNRYSVVSSGSGSNNFTYDANGNMTSKTISGVTTTYDWDAENRLLKITQGSDTSEFTYDGFGRRVEIIEKTSGSTTSDKKFVWCAAEICEERSVNGTVNKRFFPEGLREGNDGYFYARDHLGSVRELVDATQSVRARYDYDPYGRVTKIEGDKETDFQFAGMYIHASSQFNLTPFRPYDPKLSRWLGRDPIGEATGINLYSYCFGSPVTWSDVTGLFPGQYPPAPKGYDPGTWKQGQWSNGRWNLTDPAGNVWTVHPEDDGHWRHWDKMDKNTKVQTRVPANCKKRKPNQKKKPDRSDDDPSGGDPEWQPVVPPTPPQTPAPQTPPMAPIAPVDPVNPTLPSAPKIPEIPEIPEFFFELFPV